MPITIQQISGVSNKLKKFFFARRITKTDVTPRVIPINRLPEPSQFQGIDGEKLTKLYELLRNWIKEGIENVNFVGGEVLPIDQEIAERYSVSLKTAANALNLLSFNYGILQRGNFTQQ